ncbi:unnamed protein product, partial [Mesorhabditis spiculigera]
MQPALVVAALASCVLQVMCVCPTLPTPHGALSSTPTGPGNPPTCAAPLVCYNDPNATNGPSDDCYDPLPCDALPTTEPVPVKTETALITTTDPPTCPTGETCYSAGTPATNACYMNATTTMASTTGATSEATGSTAATGSTTASSEYTGSCVDSNTNCATWTKNGFCNNNAYTTLQKGQYCAKSCNLQPACAGGGGGGGVVTGCSDDSANCPTWTKNGFCTSSFYASQVQTCRKSCNLC